MDPFSFSGWLFLASFAAPQAAFKNIPSGGPLLPLVNSALVLGAVGYCGYNSVFTGKGRRRDLLHVCLGW